MSTLGSAPLHAALRPGFPVLRRDQDTLQVGLRPPYAVRLRDRPGVRTLLEALRTGTVLRALPDDDAAAALVRLRRAGLLVEPGPHTAHGPEAPDHHLFGASARTRRAARAALRVAVEADPAAAPGLGELLAEAGLATADTGGGVDVVLVVTAGPLARPRTDDLVRAGTPHLVVSGNDDRRRVGPFAVPGLTACVRCVDAHEAEADPRLPLLLVQAAEAPAPPVDPTLARLALAWAVRDLARFAEGEDPSTWSATVDIGATAAPEVTSWLRHPHCGCAWDVLLEA